jgi:hypothetical protein
MHSGHAPIRCFDPQGDAPALAVEVVDFRQAHIRPLYESPTYPANLCPIEFGASKERFATAHDHSAQ